MEWDLDEVVDQVKQLTLNQKMALFGFLLVKMEDNLRFRQMMIEGIQQMSNLQFDEFGFLTSSNNGTIQ